MNIARRFFKSFGHALDGLGRMIKNEPNARFHLIAAAWVLCFGFYFHLTAVEWISIAFAIGSVIAAEAFNTAIESLADVVKPHYDDRIKYVKDIAAGAVLITAIAAAAVGLIVFVPKFM